MSVPVLTHRRDLRQGDLVFPEEILRIGHTLDFQLDCVSKEVQQEVFGPELDTSSLCDWLNLHTAYDFALQDVADHIEITLCRNFGKKAHPFLYPLNRAERDVLRGEMEACCQRRTDRSLAQQYSHLLTTEEAEPPELTVGTHRLPMGEVGFAEPMSRLENYLDYVSHRPGVQMDGEHGLWCAGGKVRNLSQAVREVAEHTGSVWTPVVAIRREDAERLGYNDAESWRQLVCACAPEIARGYKIPLEHLRWYAAFHRKEDSVHIHMVVFSSDPKEGYLTRQGIQQVKSAFGRRIFQQDLLHVYEQKTEYRDTLSRDAERTMAELIAQMETGQLQNENLERLVLELTQRLQSTKGKKVYGYLPPKTKALVDAIVDELAKDECVAAAYDLWNQMREEVCRTYSEQMP